MNNKSNKDITDLPDLCTMQLDDDTAKYAKFSFLQKLLLDSQLPQTTILNISNNTDLQDEITPLMNSRNFVPAHI